MRIISLLGAEESNKKKSKQQKVGEDTFGMDDDDWNVYRTIVSVFILGKILDFRELNFRARMLMKALRRGKILNYKRLVKC